MPVSWDTSELCSLQCRKPVGCSNCIPTGHAAQRGGSRSKYLIFLENLESDRAARHIVGHELDLAVVGLVTLDVLLEGTHERLGVLGRGNDAGKDLGLLRAGQHAGKIQDELGARVRDDDEVGVNAFPFLVADLDIDGSLVGHRCSLMMAEMRI